ncbi:crosslink repair DNA glycosylase YcaQ family protein [Microbacterium sp. NPDC076911]|uniref:DNA glycosylase AlkZ-like family protein n=1 Tax=Microbacterium sp. NPDC076911 TaxID=3154958 RepID=UPI003443144C
MSAQLLDQRRPAGIVETIDALMYVNIEPTAAVAPSADLILWSRLGWPYDPTDLTRLVEVDRAVFEWDGFYRPMADLPLLRHEMAARPRSSRARSWLAANDRFREEVLAQLEAQGPLRASQIPDTAQQSWRSTGWTNNRNSMQMLEILVARGEVAISRRDAAGRVFDLAERVYPSGMPTVSPVDAGRERAVRRIGSMGIARAKSLSRVYEAVELDDVAEAATVEGTNGVWWVDSSVLNGNFLPRTALLSPFDRMVFDRARLEELFEFEYLLEMYKPAAARRWGYFALPILHGDQFVGKLDAKVDRKAGVLRVQAMHEDTRWSRGVRDDVEREISALASWLGVELAR